MITIQVPTHPYLKKFLLHRANATNGRVVVSSTESWGLTLWKILERAPYRVDKSVKTEYSTHITFLISESMYNRSGFHLTDQNIYLFNQYLQQQFEESLFDFVTINMINVEKATIESMVCTFLEYYNISETDRALQTILKAYQRWRKKRNYKLIRL